MRKPSFFAVLGASVLTASACSEALTPPTAILGDTTKPAAPDTPLTRFWPASGLTYVAGGDLWFIGERPPAQLVASFESSVVAHPAWSPDGSRVAFAKTGSGSDVPWAIHILNKNGTETRLSPEGVYEMGPSWSPDGKRIAFLSRETGNDELYVMNADGTNRVRLTDESLGRPGLPEWSPDGRRIAFALWQGYITGINLINPDGTDRVRLTNAARAVAGHERPTWSPDGRWIAFVSETGGIGFIELADATNMRHIQRDVPVGNLTWSPDGRYIAFNDVCIFDDCPHVTVGFVRVADGHVYVPTGAFGYYPAWVP